MNALIPFPDIDPILISFNIFDWRIAIHWYAISYIVAFIIAWHWVLFLISCPHLSAFHATLPTKKQVEDLLTWVIIGTLLGGRLGYVLFYNFANYALHPMQIFYIWQGGMSAHGGFIGVIVATYLFTLKHQFSPLTIGDYIASSAPIGLFLGRIANFINGELWGKPTDMPWGVVFPSSEAQNCALYVGKMCARHPSQLYEALFEGLFLFILLSYLIFQFRILKIPGLVTGIFLFVYGVARTVIEVFRQGDRQFVTVDNPWGYIVRFGSELDSFGLSMGQLLSLPLIIVGFIIIMVVWSKNKSQMKFI